MYSTQPFEFNACCENDGRIIYSKSIIDYSVKCSLYEYHDQLNSYYSYSNEHSYTNSGSCVQLSVILMYCSQLARVSEWCDLWGMKLNAS